MGHAGSAGQLVDLVRGLGAGEFDYDLNGEPFAWVSDKPKPADESRKAYSELLRRYPDSGYWPVFITEDPSGVSVDEAFVNLGIRRAETTWFEGVSGLHDFSVEHSRLGLFRVEIPIQVLALFGIEPSDLNRSEWVRSLEWFGSQEIGPAIIWNGSVTFLVADGRFTEMSDERFEFLMKETKHADLWVNPFKKGSSERSFTITW